MRHDRPTDTGGAERVDHLLEFPQVDPGQLVDDLLEGRVRLRVEPDRSHTPAAGLGELRDLARVEATASDQAERLGHGSGLR